MIRCGKEAGKKQLLFCGNSCKKKVFYPSKNCRQPFTSPLTPMSSAIHAAIEQLRAEIISQDWQISPRRLILLRGAFGRLSSFFAQRSHALALLKMAISVVNHLEQHGVQAAGLDFLKENMAHIVSLYEEDEEDTGREKELVRRTYKRFLRLNIPLLKGEVHSHGEHQSSSALLEKLESILQQVAPLPGLLEQSGTLSQEEEERVAALLIKISTAVSRATSNGPSASRGD